MSNQKEFTIKNGALIRYDGAGGDVTVPEEVTSIAEGAFAGCGKVTAIALPEGVTEIGKNAFAGCTKLSVIHYSGTHIRLKPDMMGLGRGEAAPKPFRTWFAEHYPELGDSIPLSDAMLKEVIGRGTDWNKLSVSAQAELFLTRQSRTLEPVFRKLIKDADEFGGELLTHLSGNVSAKTCAAVAGFMEDFVRELSADTGKALYEAMKPLKSADKALKTIRADSVLVQKFGIKKTSARKIPAAEQLVIDDLQERGMSVKDQNALLQKFYGKISVPQLRYQDGKRAAPIVLQWLLTAHEQENIFGGPGVDAAYEQPGLCPRAADAVGALDSQSLQKALDKLLTNMRSQSGDKQIYLLYPICRYADEQAMEALTQTMWSYHTAACGRDSESVLQFRKACKYSLTRSAMFFADRCGDLEEYAEIRGADADTIRDRYLSDVGISEQGEKAYDLGNQTVTVRLQTDLSFLVVTEAGKTMKSIPKRGADPEQYETACTDFTRLQQEAKRIVRNRSTILFRDFLSGRTRPAEDWKRAYLHNPLLRAVGKLLVWKQGVHTFTLTDTGAVTADGSVYQPGEEAIAVAHPMEMKAEDVSAWQKYFTANGLKQPFAQIWEPVIASDSVRKDRYEGCTIPYYRFRGMEKHGILADDLDFHGTVDISFAGCEAEVERVEWKRHVVDQDERFEVKNFSFEKYTRQVNHIVTYLDRVTVYDRICRDDTSVESILPGFTLAQITEFIRIAAENHCTNVTALLLNYKNEHFADFDPMEEFTLE